MHFVGARKGASGTADFLKSQPPLPKAWINPALVGEVMARLQDCQSGHSRLDLAGILRERLLDKARDRYRVVWSKHMITAAGLSKAPGGPCVLHFRDGEEERGDNPRSMKRVLQGVHAKGGRGGEAVIDFFYLTFVHEAAELHQRETDETLSPGIKTEIRAEIEEAKAYFSLPIERRKMLRKLYELLDATDDPTQKIYSRELEVFESLGREKLATLEGLLTLIDFVLAMPDYSREARQYPDERTRLQLARSLFVDLLHDFGGGRPADDWVREVENAGTFAEEDVVFAYTEQARALSEEAEELLSAAARGLQSFAADLTDPKLLPDRKQKERLLESFNRRMAQLAPIKARLRPNEVLSIPESLRSALEDNRLNRHFSIMDDLGIYHSLDLSRLDLQGLNLHSGYDGRTDADRAREANQHRDERSDLRGAQLFGSDLSGGANLSQAQLDFVIASLSNFQEANFSSCRAVGMVLYGANANEAQFERARMSAVDARGLSVSFARIQMEETDINGMKVWLSDVKNWQRAYVDVSQRDESKKQAAPIDRNRETLKGELDFLDDSFLDELDALDESDSLQGEETWIELREVDGQVEFLKRRGIVFFSREERLQYSLSDEPAVDET